MPDVKFSPDVLDMFCIQLKNALAAMGDEVPADVRDKAQEFRTSVKQWSEKLRAEVSKKAGAA